MEIFLKRREQIAKLNAMALKDLMANYRDLKKSLMLLRMKKSDIKDMSQFKKLKKSIARVGSFINKNVE